MARSAAVDAAAALTSLLRAPLAKLPEPRPLRREGSKVQAAAIRAVFAALGIRGVSVRMSRGSMCYWPEVNLPRLRCDVDHFNAPLGSDRDRRTCPTCTRNAAARRRVEHIIERAFPDMVDRSDSQSDYFDPAYVIHA